jgi:hypothetical protein
MSARDVYELSCCAPGAVAVLKVFMDESGIHDDSPVVTVAAYVAKPKTWREWTKKWNVAKRPIKVFHAADAQNLRGEFEGWTGNDQDSIVKKILPVLSMADMRGICIGIHLAEYRKAMDHRPDLKMYFGTPYGACFQWVVQSIIYLQAKQRNNERIAFVHEVNDFYAEAMDSFNFAKHNTNPLQAPLGILFGDKADYAPLQAADVLAYEGNKRLRDPDRPPRRSWSAINNNGQVRIAHYGRQNMGTLVSSLEKIKDSKPEEIVRDTEWMRFLTHSSALSS